MDLLRIFLAILSWKTVVDAGHPSPLWCNDSIMILSGDNLKVPQAVVLEEGSTQCTNASPSVMFPSSISGFR